MAKKVIARAITSFDVALGKKIAEIRKGQKMTMEALGKRVGVTFQQIGKYEAGTNRLCVSRFVQICSALGVDPAIMLAEI